ncbi:MAG: cytochrome c [Chloroflexi bacterium]|nr:cytochrome c [Chloroflexota bacterium]
MRGWPAFIIKGERVGCKRGRGSWRPAFPALSLAVVLLTTGCSGGPLRKPAHGGQTGTPVLRIPPDADTSLSETLPGADTTVNKIFTEQCEQCHSIGKVGTKSYPLDREGTRHNKKWIEVQIRHPEKHNPDTAMPLFPLDRMTDSELDDLAGYLARLK